MRIAPYSNRSHRLLPPLLAALLLALTPPAQAATYEVAPHGSDGAACSGLMRTIHRGLLCLRPGDTLYLRSGTYPEGLNTFTGTQFPSGTSWDQPITIASYPGETAIIQPGSDQTHTLLPYSDGGYSSGPYVQYLIFDRLVFDGTYTDHNIKLDIGSRYIRIQHSVIRTSRRGNGMAFGGDAASPQTYSRYNEILANEIVGHPGYGIYVGSSDNRIEGNTFRDNRGYGVHTYSDYGGVDRNLIANNRFVHNGSGNGNPAGSCAIVAGSGTGNRVCGNLIEDHQGCGIQVYGTGVDTQVSGNTVRGTTLACIDVNPGARQTLVEGNECPESAVVDRGQGTVVRTSRAAAEACGAGTLGPSAGLPTIYPAASNFRVLAIER